MHRDRKTYRAVAIGVSMGGVEALRSLLGGLPGDFPLPIIIVHHIGPDTGSELALLLNRQCSLHVKEADEEETVAAGTVYLAPPNYHLLVEGDGRLALSTDPPVNFARPSVDVLFESAAHAYGPELIGIILTGAGSDGSRGLKTITDKGGLAIIQDPVDADADSMPRSALATVGTGHVLPLLDISRFLCTLAEKGDTKTEETCPPAKE
jgi:two-component system chemotaxis response regulator CheB